jgi:hypothetical protein
MSLGNVDDPACIQAEEEFPRGSGGIMSTKTVHLNKMMAENDSVSLNADEGEDESPLLSEKPSRYLRKSFNRVKSFRDGTIESMRKSSPVPIKQLVAIW